MLGIKEVVLTYLTYLTYLPYLLTLYIFLSYLLI